MNNVNAVECRKPEKSGQEGSLDRSIDPQQSLKPPEHSGYPSCVRLLRSCYPMRSEHGKACESSSPPRQAHSVLENYGKA